MKHQWSDEFGWRDYRTELLERRRADVSEPKRAYSTPTLTVYGDVKEITRTNGTGFLNDGSGPTKTS